MPFSELMSLSSWVWSSRFLGGLRSSIRVRSPDFRRCYTHSDTCIRWLSRCRGYVFGVYLVYSGVGRFHYAYPALARAVEPLYGWKGEHWSVFGGLCGVIRLVDFLYAFLRAIEELITHRFSRPSVLPLSAPSVCRPRISVSSDDDVRIGYFFRSRKSRRCRPIPKTGCVRRWR